MTRHQLSYSGLSIILLVVSLIAVNVVAYFLPLRWDVTEEKLFTISEGTRKIIEGLEDPVNLKFYFSSSEELPPHIKTYAQRVKEVLEEYEYLSDGSIRLEIFDPKPDTEVEEWAQKYGIGQIPLPSGDSMFFGMVAIMLDQEVTLPFFDVRREEFLEYDISQAILKVSSTKTTKIGILTPLTIMGVPDYLANRPNMPQKWTFVSELEKNFEVENLPLTTEEIPDDINILMVMHPKEFGKRLMYAIDQYVLRGGHLVVMVDPNSREDMRTSGQFSQQAPRVTSDMPELLKKWGINYDSSKVVGDVQYATPVNAGPSGVLRYPLWMSLESDALDRQHPVTSQLEGLLWIEAGQLNKLKDSDVEFTPLISTSPQSAAVEAFLLRFSGPDKIAKQIQPDNISKTVAALVRGTFNSAFPGGQPPKEEEKEEENKDSSETPQPLKHSHLTKAEEPNVILVISDVDFASDAFSVRKMSFLGQVIVQPTNDNLNFILNAVEYLSGNDALMSIRSRGRFSRPFTRLIALQQQAQERYQAEEVQLQKKLDDVRERLKSLQESAGSDQKVILPPEVQQEIQQFRQEERNTRKRLREVRKILRQDIESLGNWLLALNMLAVPVLVGVAGFFSYGRRARKRHEAMKS